MLHSMRFAGSKLLNCTACLLLLFFQPFSFASERLEPLRLLVVPQYQATEINNSWGTLLEGLNKGDVPKIELIFAKDISDFEAQFLAGKADLIYCNPYHMVMAKKAQGYLPLLRDKKPLKGILISLKNRDGEVIEDLKSLEGKTILFPSPNSFGASLYMRALLSKDIGINFTTKYVKTHPNVIRGVVRDEGQAGGMVAATYFAEADILRDKTKVIYETPPAPPHPIAAHPRVDEATRELLTRAFIAFIQSNKEAGIAIQIPDPVRSNYAKDYQPLERLGLEAFVAQ